MIDSSVARPCPTLPVTESDYESLSAEQLDQVAHGAASALMTGRLMLGRCLMEIERRHLDEEWGYSGAIHYAIMALKVDERQAKEARRVARRLVELPLLGAAAEAGDLGWSHLREVVRVATPETEEAWLHAALTRPYPRLERLVARRSRGQFPDGDPDVAEPELVEFRVRMTPEEAEFLNHTVAAMSAQAGRRLDLRETLNAIGYLVRIGDMSLTPRRLAAADAELAELVRLREEQDREEMEAIEREVEEGRPAESPAVPGGPARVQGAEVETVTVEEGPVRVQPTRAVVAAEGPVRVQDRPSFMLYDAPQPGHSTSCEEQPDYQAGLPELPWAAAGATEAPCPGEPDLILAVHARVPHWELPDAPPQTRYISRDTRRHVQRRDGFACACPGCPNRVWLDMHHIVFWCRGGLSLPPNLVLVCTRCHRNIHKGRLRVRGNAEKGLDWTDRSGRRLGHIAPERHREAVRLAGSLLVDLLHRQT